MDKQLVQPVLPTKPVELTCPDCRHLWRLHTKVGCWCRCMTDRPVTSKTRTMERIERYHGVNIETLLATDYSNYQLAEMLDVSFTTVSKWRKRLRKGGDTDG